MSKQKIKVIVSRFLKGNDPECVKESIERIYGRAMLSKGEISPQERHEFTYDCREIVHLLNDLKDIQKRIQKKIFKKLDEKDVQISNT